MLGDAVRARARLALARPVGAGSAGRWLQRIIASASGWPWVGSIRRGCGGTGTVGGGRRPLAHFAAAVQVRLHAGRGRSASLDRVQSPRGDSDTPTAGRRCTGSLVDAARGATAPPATTLVCVRRSRTRTLRWRSSRWRAWAATCRATRSRHRRCSRPLSNGRRRQSRLLACRWRSAGRRSLASWMRPWPPRRKPLSRSGKSRFAVAPPRARGQHRQCDGLTEACWFGAPPMWTGPGVF